MVVMGTNLLQEEIFFSFTQTSKCGLVWIIIEINYLELCDHVHQYKIDRVTNKVHHLVRVLESHILVVSVLTFRHRAPCI